MIALGVAIVLILALAMPLMILVFAEDIGGHEGLAPPPVTVTRTAPAEATKETPTGAPKKRAEVIGPGDVGELPAGLFCRDLLARQYGYVAAVDYWRRHGQPNQMDVERNGIPCETVYPEADVRAYWGTWQRVTPNYVGVESLPGGLFCRDLRDRGYTYGQTVDYWVISGAPDRMDEDLNGIPCETVFPIGEVGYYWYG